MTWGRLQTSLIQETQAGQAATHLGPVRECKHIFVLFKMKLRVQVLTITAPLEIAHKASSRDRWPRQNTLPFPIGQQAAPVPVLLGAGLSLGGMEATPPRVRLPWQPARPRTALRNSPFRTLSLSLSLGGRKTLGDSYWLNMAK